MLPNDSIFLRTIATALKDFFHPLYSRKRSLLNRHHVASVTHDSVEVTFGPDSLFKLLLTDKLLLYFHI